MQPLDREGLAYRSGDIFLGPKVRKFLEIYHIGGPTTLFYVSNWSFVHMLSGILTAWILFNYFSDYDFYLTGFSIHSIWELWQILIGMTNIMTKRGAIDIVVDTVFFMAGMIIYSAF
jgi:hypothetical protein